MANQGTQSATSTHQETRAASAVAGGCVGCPLASIRGTHFSATAVDSTAAARGGAKSTAEARTVPRTAMPNMANVVVQTNGDVAAMERALRGGATVDDTDGVR